MMKQKIKIQKGFIQIPILIAIIVSVVVASGVGYGIIEYYRASKIVKEAEQLMKEEKYDEAIKKLEFAQNKLVGKILSQKINTELEKNKKLLGDKSEYTQGVEEFNKGNWERAKELLSKISEISPHYQDAKSKIKEAQKKIIEKQIAEATKRSKEELKEEIEKAKKISEEAQRKLRKEEAKRRALEAQRERATITTAEIQPYLTGVGRIDCVGEFGTSVGSASLWKFDEPFGYSTLTNEHVITSDYCLLNIPGAPIIPGTEIERGKFWLNTDAGTYNWYNGTDVAVVPILHDFILGAPPTDLNYSIGTLPLCSPEMPLNSPVIVIGFSAFTHVHTEGGIFATRTVTEGIISSYEKSLQTEYRLPYVNYFVSATVDSGNSGGIVLSKNEYGLCVLGIPTWLNIGRFATQGMIQNIRNLLR